MQVMKVKKVMKVMRVRKANHIGHESNERYESHISDASNFLNVSHTSHAGHSRSCRLWMSWRLWNLLVLDNEEAWKLIIGLGKSVQVIIGQEKKYEKSGKGINLNLTCIWPITIVKFSSSFPIIIVAILFIYFLQVLKFSASMKSMRSCLIEALVLYWVVIYY